MCLGKVDLAVPEKFSKLRLQVWTAESKAHQSWERGTEREMRGLGGSGQSTSNIHLCFSLGVCVPVSWAQTITYNALSTAFPGCPLRIHKNLTPSHLLQYASISKHHCISHLGIAVMYFQFWDSSLLTVHPEFKWTSAFPGIGSNKWIRHERSPKQKQN